MVWPLKRTNELVYGLAEGKKIGDEDTSLVHCTRARACTAMACNPAGDAVVSAHLDGTIYTFY